MMDVDEDENKENGEDNSSDTEEDNPSQMVVNEVDEDRTPKKSKPPNSNHINLNLISHISLPGTSGSQYSD